MKYADSLKQFQSKPRVDLEKEIADERKKLWQLSVDLRAGKVKNVADMKRIRKNIARMLTVLQTRSEKITAK